jgi:hypothetical protein
MGAGGGLMALAVGRPDMSPLVQVCLVTLGAVTGQVLAVLMVVAGFGRQGGPPT